MQELAQPALLDESPVFDPVFLRAVAKGLRNPCLVPFQAPAAAAAQARRSYRDWMQGHLHSHPFYEIMVVLRGTCLCGIDEDVFPCKPGSVVVFRPNQAHVNRYRAHDDGLRHLWISFVTDEQAFLQIVDVRRGRARRLHAGRGLMPVANLIRLLRSLEKPAETATLTASVRRNLFIRAFYAELMTGILDIGIHPLDSIDHEALLQRKVAMICRHIAAENRFRASLPELAHVAGYSPSHFARIFKRITGHTIHQHINACRIQKAKELMAAGIPYKGMCNALGFSDKTALSRWLNQYRHAIAD